MQEKQMLERFIAWGNQNDVVRGIIMTSSRASPLGVVDIFSDFDLILALTNVREFHDERQWLEAFGHVLALYRDPLMIDDGLPNSGYVVQYEDGLKIDFTLWQVEKLQQLVNEKQLPDEFDAGYRVLLDKDNLTNNLKPPTYKAYIPNPPTQQEYEEHIEVFFLDTTYVAKFLWREDLVAAKHLLDHFIKQEHLIPILAWHIEIENNWSVKPGLYGQRLKKQLRPDLWEIFENTYTDSNIEHNWDALFRSIELFRKTAIEVGQHLNYVYRYDIEQRTVAYLHRIKNLAKDAKSIS